MLQDNDLIHQGLTGYINMMQRRYEHFDMEYRMPAAMESRDGITGNRMVATRSLDDVVKQLDESFSASLLRRIDDKGYTDVEVYKRAGIDRKLFSKIRSRDDYQPSKDTAIALCLGLKLSLDETRDLLAKAGYALSDSSRRDIIFRFFIEQGIYDLFVINEALDHFGETCLN